MDFNKLDIKFNTNYLELLLKQAQKKEEDPIHDIIQKALLASCTVFGKSGKSTWTGSGFLIGQGVLVTAGHVADPEEEQGHIDLAVTFDSKSIYPCSMLKVDHNIDAALLYCKQVAHLPAVKLGNSDTAEVGDIIAVVSSPEGWADSASVGRISNIHQALNDPQKPSWNDIIFIDAEISEGSSGGMCLTTDGLVVGSVMGVVGTHSDIGMGQRAICPSNKIIKMVQEQSR